MAPTLSVYQPLSTVLSQMIARLQANGSRITDFNIGSGTRDLFEAFAIVISNNSAVADQLQLDSYLDTATGAALDALASNWLVMRKPAVRASGQVTITRQSTSGALLIPAGWGQLVTTPAAPGDTGIAVVTTQDASFADTVAAVVVAAQAVQGGQAGNLSAATFLTPLAPVNTVSSQNGYEVTTAFTGGVDQEPDDAFRSRIPIAVQGRVLGRAVSFLAGALGVPGVLSANVLTASSLRGDGSQVPAGSVEVYYQGSVGLLAAVQSAADAAATANQYPHAYAAVSLTAPRGPQRVLAHVGVYALAGTDPVALAVAVTAAMQGYVNNVGVGNTAYASGAIEAITQVTGVLAVVTPLAQFSLYSAPPGTVADVASPGDGYPNLAAADTTVAVTII